MLLLRTVVGTIALIQGARYLSAGNFTPEGVLAAGLAGLSGGLLVVGFFSAASSVVIALYSAAIGFAWLPTIMLDNRLTAILLVTAALTLALAGPGAFSIDARIFGHREIIIPPPKS